LCSPWRFYCVAQHRASHRHKPCGGHNIYIYIYTYILYIYIHIYIIYMHIWHTLTAGELPHYAMHPLPFCFNTPTWNLAPSTLPTAGELPRHIPHPLSNRHFPHHLSNRQANCRLSLSSCKSLPSGFQ
jgi:hypothetical protein